ncbi:hypothetical protein BS17DRAFT_777730 [Gyrodon lividus]|nr:hypothetical protein BS17DRAFT_777730 [Gyrodon lividus]
MTLAANRWICQLVPSKVYDEMNNVRDALRGTISSITPEFPMTWDINSTMDRIVDESAPTLQASRSLDRAVQVAQGPHIFCYDNININLLLRSGLGSGRVRKRSMGNWKPSPMRQLYRG